MQNCVTQSDWGGHQRPCGPQKCQERVWPAHIHPTQCVGSLCTMGIGLHSISTSSAREIPQNQRFVMQSDKTNHLCPCGPQRRQERVWPAHTDPTQCAGSLYSV
jgi:hypothetical protein